jgi:uracil-DNA glycosylase
MHYKNENCLGCPYFKQSHLLGSKFITNRSFPPVCSEINGSDTLLVFQSPGIKEWDTGLPLQATKKQGGTAGSRIELSWSRTGVHREQFDITNAVLCYAGHNGRDKPPESNAERCCMHNLRATIDGGNYSRIISFGNIANRLTAEVLGGKFVPKQHIVVKHPCGGLKNKDLDSLWRVR